MKVTGVKLRDREACEDQVKIFEEEWPSGCTITLKVLRRAALLRLDLDWFARKFLPHKGRKFYEKKLAPLDADYEKKLAPLDADYQKKRAPLLWAALKV